jgi:hypothetical protein
MEVSGQLHNPVALPPGKELAVPIGSEAGCAPRQGDEKNSKPLPGLERPTIQPVAHCYTIELSRLVICDK